MQKSQLPPSRKKFLLWSAVALCSATIFKFIPGKKKQQIETIKMLTQDGKLVEIDKALLVTSGKKISNEELQKWITK